MKKKIIILTLILTIVLSGCGKKTNIEDEIEIKQGNGITIIAVDNNLLPNTEAIKGYTEKINYILENKADKIKGDLLIASFVIVGNDEVGYSHRPAIFSYYQAKTIKDVLGKGFDYKSDSAYESIIRTPDYNHLTREHAQWFDENSIYYNKNGAPSYIKDEYFEALDPQYFSEDFINKK